MKVLTWNINGIRAVQRDKEKIPLKKVLDSLDADIICLQETKVTRDMLDEPTAVVDGFESYFSFSRKKSGYSGTANYCKTQAIPAKAEEGLTGKLSKSSESNVSNYGNVHNFSEEELQALDDEGRCVITQHKIRMSAGEDKEVAIINVYVPRAGDREDRHQYKLQFLTLLQIRAEAILKTGVHVIILGDINTTHRKIDNCDSEADVEYLRKSSRIWLNKLLCQEERDATIPFTDANLSEMSPSDVKGGLFTDVFRHLHPNQENAFTNWCTSTGARQTNFGRRLDYILIDSQLAKEATQCEIMSDFEGSDHCPVVVTLNCSIISSSSSPSLCSKFMPEFRGQQKKLSAFFSKSSKSSEIGDNLGSSLKVKDTSSSSSNNMLTPQLHKNNNLKRHSSNGTDNMSKKAKLKKGTSATSSSTQGNLKSFFSQKNKDKQLGNKFNGDVETSRVVTENDTSITIICDEDDDFHQSSQNLNKPAIVTPHFNDLNSNSKDALVKVEKDVVKSVDEQSNSDSCQSSNSQKKTTSASAWKGMLRGLPPAPLCPGHKESCVLRTVKKSGPNKNKQFYVCSRPDGAPGNPLSRCNFFQWVTAKKKT